MALAWVMRVFPFRNRRIRELNQAGRLLIAELGFDLLDLI